jgi:uncharacterized membrane protein YhaH (DUF805 family)
MPQSELTDPVSKETYTPKFFALDGRIGRVRYLAYSIGAGLLMMPVMILLVGMSAFTGALTDSAGGGGLFGALIAYGLSFAVTVILARRRLHDLGKTAWLGLLLFVPFVNFIVALWMLFAAGDAQANEYGPPPGPNTKGVIILAWILPVIFVVGILAAISIPAYQDYVNKARAAQMENSQ